MSGLADHRAARGPHPAPVQQWCSLACVALESGKCLEVQYETFSRIVEVHRVGVSPQGGHILSGWQIRGLENERPGWKLLNLDEGGPSDDAALRC